MARTKADAYVKASVKASRKASVLAPGSSIGSPRTSKGDKYAGGNPYCPRPTPPWQKPITNFFGSSGSAQIPTVEKKTEAEIQTNNIAEDSICMMSYRENCNSDYRSSTEVDQQYSTPTNDESRYGCPDSSFFKSNTLPLRQKPIQNGSGYSLSKEKKRIDKTTSKEQETLLDRSPVQLIPYGETKDLPSDELNFKIITSKTDFYNVLPVDRLNLVFLIFMLHGIGTLTPWNMFITAESYFVNYKLNGTATNNATEMYKNHFLSYLGVAAQVPNVICNALNIFVQFGGGSITYRIVGSIVVEMVIFIVTVILAMLDSSTWPGTFFYITMASVVIINMVNGMYQNSIYGLAAKLPMKYSMAIILGSNTSGTFSSLIRIISIAVSPNEKTAAVYYFFTALLVLVVCIITYFSLSLTRFYRYHERLVQKAIGDSKKNSSCQSFCKVFGKIWLQCFNVWFVFFVTLTIFPAIHANIEPVNKSFIVSKKYFTPVACFLTFNFFAMMGSLIPNWIKWPGPRFLWIPVLLRVLMIPLFVMCNYMPDRRSSLIPVFVTNDWAFIGMGVVLGLTSGYYSSLAMMYAPKCVDTEYAPIAGMISAFFLIFGIVCGVNFTFVISWIVGS